MRTAPVVAAEVAFDADGTPRSPRFDDVYHPRGGAAAQARHVFLAGNGLPGRWRGRDRFVVLEAGFGLGNNFLATWRAWRDDPQRPARLHFVSIEAYPPTRETLAALPRDDALRDGADELAAAWPPLTANLHRLRFDAGRVELLLAFGDVAAWLPQLTARIDAFFLDGFAPSRNPAMWEPRVCKAMARLAAPGATAATWSAARPVRDGLRTAGFDVASAPGGGGKRDITVATFAPRFAAPLPPRSRVAADRRDARIVVVGAGLAGCAIAHSLAEQGLASTVVDAADRIAAGASGNPAGVFHGVVHADDGRHARWHRSAALAAASEVEAFVAARAGGGAAEGLLRLASSGADVAALHRVARDLGLPDDYARPVDAAEAARLAAVRLAAPGWLFAAGGWVDAGALARHRLACAGDAVELRLRTAVASLRRRDDAWVLLDADGATIAPADIVVCANGFAAAVLLGAPGWPLACERGQMTAVDLGDAAPALAPSLPVAGAGYAVAVGGGRLWFGATAQADAADEALRVADDDANWRRAVSLLPELAAIEPRFVAARAAIRCTSADRLPLIGAVPDIAGVSARPEQPRFTPRARGLFVSTALGSRGIASSSLSGAVVAAQIAGAPLPVEADLLDAVDPARFACRRARDAG